MRAAIAVAFALLVGCGSHAPAPTAPSADAVAEVKAAYAGYAHAVETNDLAGVMAVVPANGEWRLRDGTVQHHAEIEASMKDFLASIPPGSKVFFTYDDVTEQADGSVQAHVVFHRETPGDSATHASAWHDTWVKGPTGWQNTLGLEQP